MPMDYSNSETLLMPSYHVRFGAATTSFMSKSVLTTLRRCQISQRLFGGYTANKSNRVKFVLAATLP